MRHGKTLIVSALALLLASYLVPAPAQAQSPGRVLGPITAPLRMILRGVPRPRRAHRTHRAPRVDRGTAAERTRSRRQAARSVAAAAGAAAVFWPIAAPDAFEDMLGYAFWPREYGPQFWSHGPRDILRAMTAPTAAFAAEAEERPSRQRLAGAVPSANAAESGRALCVARVKDQAVRPLDRIDQAITLTPEQRQGLDDLRTAVRTAIDGEAAACRGDLPATQPERLRAMIDGLWAMRYAEFRIRPALETFHGSLTDAQKTQLAEEPQTVGGGEAAPETATPATICSEPVAADANPFDPIQRALQPTAEQRKSLQMLFGASMEMAQFLNSTCPAETPATPMARLSAASDRVILLLHAAMNIEPVLGEFYGTLSDQQRRRFNSVVR